MGGPKTMMGTTRRWTETRRTETNQSGRRWSLRRLGSLWLASPSSSFSTIGKHRVTNFLLGFSEALQATRQRIPTPLPSRQRLQQQQEEEQVEEEAGEHLLQVKVSHHRLWRRSRKNLRHLNQRSPCQIIPRQSTRCSC